jgi:hypothetical protein
MLPLMLDESGAAARLAELRHNFVGRPKAESMAALARLADEAPDTAAGARALDWLGDLRRGDGDRAGARAAYARAYRSSDAEGHRLGARGLGDLDVEQGAFVRGEALYREARTGAGGVLALELDQKIANARRQHRRALVEWLAWLWVVATLAYFLARSRFWRRPRPGLPAEVLYVVPVYALIIAGCLGRDPAVLHALWLCAVWSLALIAAAGLAAHRVAPSVGARLAHAALLVAANGALFYAVLNRTGTMDALFMTVAP